MATTADRRTHLRHGQSVDGIDPLPYEDTATCEYRDEPAYVGLQLQTIDANSRDATSPPSSESITSFISLIVFAGRNANWTQSTEHPKG